MNLARKQQVRVWIFLACLPLMFSSGCILSQLIYVIKGHKTKAEFQGLANKKVAVLCMSEAQGFGHDSLTTTISKTVGLKIQQSVKKVQVVPHSRVEDWLDNNDWNRKDMVRFGKGVGAEKVVTIEIGNYSIHEGSTLYKGRSTVRVRVYDIADDGNVEFEKGPSEYIFPTTGRPAIQTNDRNFEAIYLAKLTENISNHFCDYDALDRVAEDASLMY
ncbi:MAG: hypothetical protein KF851_20020 [Pirellulaceae bacterium]|nr:hypothetical protein [Pirellulaceae bacterium]